MATETVKSILSKEAIEEFINLKKNVNDSTDSIEKLISVSVQLNNTLGKSNSFKDINNAAAAMASNDEALKRQVADLQKANEKLNRLYDEQAKKLEKLDAINKRPKSIPKEPKNIPQKEKPGPSSIPRNNTPPDPTNTPKISKEQEKLNALYSAEAQELAKLAEQRKLLNNINKQNARDTLGLTDAYEALDRAYKKAARDAQNLILTLGEQNEETQKAVALAEQYDRELKAADAAVGRFNRNVGNYSGALKILEKALGQVRDKLDAVAKSGKADIAVLEQLQKEEQLLNNLVQAQVSGFAKSSQEVKANMVALQQLAAAGLETSKAYHDLYKETAALKEEVGDLSEALKNAEPGEVAFNAAADAARGLIGLYGLATSATAALGIKNEAFEETLVKLQAAETALASIEAIRVLFKKESAFQQVLGIGLQKLTILQTNLETASQSKNIIVKYAAIAAQKALNAVMSLAGGPLLAVIGLLALLILTLSSFSSASGKAVLNFKALNAEFEKGEALLNDRVEAIKQASDVEIAELEAGFASQEKIRAARTKSLKDQRAELSAFAADNGAFYRAAYDESFSLLQRQKAGETLSKQDEARLESTIEFVNKYQAAQRKIESLNTDILVDAANNRKAAAEEQAKIDQTSIENQRTVAAERKTIAEQSAADDRKTYADRIAAQQEANAIEIQLINAQARIERRAPGLTPSEIGKIETNRQVAIQAAVREGNQKLLQLSRERAKREQDAQFEIAKIGIELRAEAAQRIAENEDKSLELRLFAQIDFYKAQVELAKANATQELANETLTATERLAIQTKLNADLLNLRIQFLKDTNRIKLDELEQDKENEVSVLTESTSRAIIALNERYNAGKISLTKYNQERQKIELEFEKNSLQSQIDNLRKIAEEKEKQGLDMTKVNEEIAQKEQELSDLTTKKRLEDFDKVKAAQIQLGEEIAGLFSDIVNAGYEKEKNAIQEQIDLNEEKKERDIAIATQTITDKQKQADEIAIIEARAAAERQALERKQRQVDVQKARFEKQQTVAKIILDTARAVVAALTSTPPNVPLSVYVGAIGAVSLARALSTPIPQYKTGTENAIGGLSIVGDGGQREWVVTPAGDILATPSVSTLANLTKGSKVYANDQKALEAGVFGDIHAAPALFDSGSQYRYMTEKIGGKLDEVKAEIRKGNRTRTRRDRTGWEQIKAYNSSKNNYRK